MAQALATDSPTFLSASTALSGLGVNGTIMVEGLVTISEEAGWPVWPNQGIVMGLGASLTVASQTGKGIIDFRMNADRLAIPTPGIVRLKNMMTLNLCTVNTPLGATGVGSYVSFPMFGFIHNW